MFCCKIAKALNNAINYRKTHNKQNIFENKYVAIISNCYCISLVLFFIFFDSQIRFILRFEKELSKATNTNKIIIDEKKVEDDAEEAREIEVETRRIETNTRVDAKIDAKETTIVATIATTTTNRKQLSKLREQFVCTYINLVFEIALILSSCLLLFSNLRECTNNTLYS